VAGGSGTGGVPGADIQLLSDAALERSWVVANCDMNRERGLVGVNSTGLVAILGERQ
jgi:hypothetical protein